MTDRVTMKTGKPERREGPERRERTDGTLDAIEQNKDGFVAKPP